MRRVPENATLFLDRLETPIGVLNIVADASGRLRATEWVEDEAGLHSGLRRQLGAGGYRLEPRDKSRPFGLTASIARYFAGDLAALDEIPVETGGTPFQREVWSALRGIPCGSTTTYSELARAIGRPAAVRAVGMANGANPVPVVVPCHRVVGADGTLTGYGGGLVRKRWLLSHEAAAKPLPLLSYRS
jgi:methylated-DNA-[protein]-cysteine S-methyltransferase